jgi:hypothetical protein
MPQIIPAQFRRSILCLAAIGCGLLGAQSLFAQDAWKTSPFHGVPNAATGQNIPCRCRFQGKDLQLGAEVCMNTPNGTMLARCDLLLNNTTWAPTSIPCQLNSQNRFMAPLPTSG